MNVQLYSLIDAAVVARLTAGMASLIAEVQSVHSQIYPDISAVADADLPAISVVEWGEAATWDGHSSESSAMWISVLALVIDKIGETTTPHSKKATYLKIQKGIVDLFRTPKSGTYNLAGVPEVKRCTVVPQVYFDRRLPGYMSVMSGVGLRFWVPEEGV